MLAYNPVSLYMAICFHVASLVCTWHIPQGRLSSQNLPRGSTTNTTLIRSPSAAAATSGGDTAACETAPLLQNPSSVPHDRRSDTEPSTTYEVRSIWRGLLPTELQFPGWNIIIMLLTTALMSTPPFINDLISLYGCSRYATTGQQVSPPPRDSHMSEKYHPNRYSAYKCGTNDRRVPAYPTRTTA